MKIWDSVYIYYYHNANLWQGGTRGSIDQPVVFRMPWLFGDQNPSISKVDKWFGNKKQYNFLTFIEKVMWSLLFWKLEQKYVSCYLCKPFGSRSEGRNESPEKLLPYNHEAQGSGPISAIWSKVISAFWFRLSGPAPFLSVRSVAEQENVF